MKLHGTNALDVSSGTLRAVDSAFLENGSLDQVGEAVSVRIQTEKSVRQVLSLSDEGNESYWDMFEGAEAEGSERELSDEEYSALKDGRAWTDKHGKVHYFTAKRLMAGNVEKFDKFDRMVSILSFLEKNGIDLRRTKKSTFNGMEQVVAHASEMFGPEGLSVEYFDSEREMLSTVPGIAVTEHPCGTLSVRSANS